MAKTKEVIFNVKECKYALAATPSTIKDVAYVDKISLQKNVSSQNLYGDGEIILEILADQGLTGSLSLVTYPEDLLKDLGFLVEVDGGGLAEVAVQSTKEIHLYVEIYAHVDGQTKTGKMWIYNVTVQKPDLSFEQSKESPVFAAFELPLTILGVNLKDNTGLEDAVDANGMKTKVWRKSVKPGNTDYANFGTTFVLPKEKAA